MKKYRNDPNIATRIVIAIISILGTLSLYFEEVFPWSTPAFFYSLFVFVLIALFSPFRFYCGVITLLINENFIEKRWLGIRVYTIDRKNAFIFSRSIFGICYIVFSKTDLRQAKVPSVLCSLINRRAMLYPYDSTILSDFPDLFV